MMFVLMDKRILPRKATPSTTPSFSSATDLSPLIPPPPNTSPPLLSEPYKLIQLGPNVGKTSKTDGGKAEDVVAVVVVISGIPVISG